MVQDEQGDLDTAANALARWQSSVCAGDGQGARDHWTPDGVLVTAYGMQRFASLYPTGAPPRCETAGCGRGACPVLGRFMRFSPDMMSVTVAMESTQPRSHCPLWSGTYLMLRHEGDWRIQMFAARF